MKSIILAFFLTLFISPCFAQKTQNKCRDWQMRIEPNTSFYFRNDKDKIQEEIYEAMDCLLKLKGKKHASNLPETSRPDVSKIFLEPTSVEVAALYYITYLVYQRWDYADAPFLVNKKGKLNTSKSVNKAYKAYQTWIKKIKEIGLEEARKQNLSPLANTNVRWY